MNTVGDWMALGCSTFALDGSLTPDGAPAVGRNFDFPAFRLLLHHQMVVVATSYRDKRGFVGVGFPGCIGVVTAMNAEGVFSSLHDVPVEPPILEALRAHVPRLLAMRRLMEQLPAEGAVKLARDLLQSWPTLYGNNVLVATPGVSLTSPFAGVLEYDYRSRINGGATLRLPTGSHGKPSAYLVCTNHHRVRARPQWRPFIPVCARYERLFDESSHLELGRGLGASDLIQLAELAAVPADKKPVTSYQHGTLHQVIGLLGKRELHIRMIKSGQHITQIPARVVSVDAVLRGGVEAEQKQKRASTGR
jgi:hypothetical protein